MSSAIVKDHQHEFTVVWQTLNEICERTAPGELLRLELQRASDTMLHLMRVAGCAEPVQAQAEVQSTEQIAVAV